MHTVIPAIIPQSLDHLEESLFAVRECASEVQIDIVDGRFVPFTSWPYRGSGSVMLLKKYASLFTLEIDLMIENPEDAVPLYVDAGAKKVVVHLEGVTNFDALKAHRKEHAYELGISIRNDTPFHILEAVLPDADYVQLMGIRSIGTQGQPFDSAVIERIEALRKMKPDLTISIDGSVNSETLPRLRNAGANRFVAGSSIFAAPDPEAAYKALVAL